MNHKHIWEVPYNHDTFDEDNDTEDDEESEEDEPKFVDVDGEKRQQITLTKRRGLEFFIDKEKQYLLKKQKKMTKTEVIDLGEIEDQLRTVLEEANMSDTRIS